MWLKAYKQQSVAGNWMYSTRWTRKSELGVMTRLPKGGQAPTNDSDYEYYLRIIGVDPDTLPFEIMLNTESGETQSLEDYQASVAQPSA